MSSVLKCLPFAHDVLHMHSLIQKL